MYQKMFSEFASSDKQSWLAQVEKDRKGKDYSELLWHVSDRLILEPYYDKKEVNDLLISDLLRVQRSESGWLNQVVINFTSTEAAFLQIREAVLGGADALWISMGDHQLNDVEWNELLNEIYKVAVPVVFESANGFSGELAYKVATNVSRGGFAFDPFSAWMQGTISLDECHGQLRSLLEFLPYPDAFRSVMVGAHTFHNAGGDAIQELAFATALLVQYLDWFTEENIPVVQVMDSLFISISINTHYLTEVAKLRALRVLYKRICDAYEVACEPAFIHARSSLFYETKAATDTNFIRTAVEAMAAVAGGCDALTILPHSSDKNRSTEFSARIARNVSLVMREEAFLDKVVDPAAGSYFIDNLTQKLIDSSWKLFLEVEKKGGLVAAFEQNFIQEELQRSCESKITAYNSGGVLVGVNKFVDKVEQEGNENLSCEIKSRDLDYRFLRSRKLEEELNSSRL